MKMSKKNTDILIEDWELDEIDKSEPGWETL